MTRYGIKRNNKIDMQWGHCHLRHVYEGQVFMESFKEYVANLPDPFLNDCLMIRYISKGHAKL